MASFDDEEERAEAEVVQRKAALRALIFDLDGVLIDWRIEALSDFLRPFLPLSIYDMYFRWEEWCKSTPLPRNTTEEALFWRSFWKRLSIELKLDPAIGKYLQNVDYTRFMRAFPDVQPALDMARGSGLSMAVLSNNFSWASPEVMMNAAGLAGQIELFCNPANVGATKPAPEAYQHVVNALGVSPEECVFFDDQESFVAGARALGIQAYLVKRDAPAHDIERGIVRDLSALRDIIS